MKNMQIKDETLSGSMKIELKQKIDEVIRGIRSEPNEGRKALLLRIEYNRHQLNNILIEAVEEGLFSADVNGLTASVLSEELLRITSLDKAKEFGQKFTKAMDDFQYVFKLMAAGSSRLSIKQVVEARNKNLSSANKHALSEFIKINPVTVTDIEFYQEIAQKSINLLQGFKIKQGKTWVMAKEKDYDACRQEILDYVQKENDTANKLFSLS